MGRLHGVGRDDEVINSRNRELPWVDHAANICERIWITRAIKVNRCMHGKTSNAQVPEMFPWQLKGLIVQHIKMQRKRLDPDFPLGPTILLEGAAAIRWTRLYHM